MARLVSKEKNIAYIDAANLYEGIRGLGWKLDYRRFRVFLQEKYDIGTAYLFIGQISRNKPLYDALEQAGYTLIYKQTVIGADGKIKGNCDAELVLQATCDFYEGAYEKAVLITGDGDFACLAEFLQQRGRLAKIISPNHEKASRLLKKAAPTNIIFLERFRQRLELKQRKRR